MVVTQYETLRSAVLGEELPPEARAGLLLFLRRGVWGWARAVATRSAPQRLTSSWPPNWNIPEEHRAVVHIFAAMAINAKHYGASP